MYYYLVGIRALQGWIIVYAWILSKKYGHAVRGITKMAFIHASNMSGSMPGFAGIINSISGFLMRCLGFECEDNGTIAVEFSVICCRTIERWGHVLNSVNLLLKTFAGIWGTGYGKGAFTAEIQL